MENKFLEIAAVQIVAHQQALLTQSDPAIAKKPLLRVPLGEGTDIGFSAADWTNAWRTGSIDFTDQYYLAHHGKSLPKDDLDKLQTYIFVNQLDPMVLQNWTVAFDRLIAVGLIHQEAPPVQIQDEPKQPKRKDITQLSDNEAKQRLVEDADAMLTESVRPVWNEFINLLERSERYLGTHEQRQLLEQVIKNGQTPNPVGRTEPITLETLFRWLQKMRPDFLTAAENFEIQKMDDLEIMKADDWRRKYKIERAGPRLGFATVSR